jgi:NitT/TauT family transport system substrate-binding protein
MKPENVARGFKAAAVIGCVLAVLLVAMLLPGCSQAGDSAGTSGGPPKPASPAKLVFIHDWVPEPEHGGYYAADRYGIWRELGIEVDVQIGGPNAEIEKRVALDTFTLGISRGDSVFVAVDRGLPVIAVNSYFQHDPQGIMVRDDGPVHSFADLEDRDVAMQVGNTWFLYLQKKYSLKRTRVRPVTGSVANFVSDPNWITQAYPTSEPYYALKAGVKPRVLQISESGFDPYRVIIANKALVEKHPELVAKFSLGAYRGWQEYFKRPLPIHEYIRTISPTMEMDGMRFSYAKMMELRLIEGDPAKGETMGHINPERWAALQRILLDLAVVKQSRPLGEVMSTNFSPARLSHDPALPLPVLTYP